MITYRIAALALATLAAGCSANRGAEASPPIAVTPSARGGADSARCAAVADSVRATTALEALPVAAPVGSPAVPRAPRDVAAGTPLRTTFLVRPDGRVDTATVAVTGTSDPGYRREMVRVLAGTRFRPVAVGDCPSWGRGDFIMVGLPRSGGPR